MLRIAAALSFAVASVASAQQILILPPPSPLPLPTSAIVNQPLQVRSHSVDVTIDGQVATTRIVQTFYNPNPTRAEGTLLLPLPRDAHIDRFTIDINGEDVPAELLDADKARGIFEEVVRSMRDPALLEYMDRQLLKARVFPIEPQAEKRVTLTYAHLLPSDAGLVRYTYPLLGRTVDGNAMPKLAMKVAINGERAIGNVYSPSHQVEVKREGDRRVTVGFETEAAGARDFELFFAPAAKDGVAVDVLTYRGADSEDGYFMLLATPDVAGAKAEPLPKDLVFVFDTSGSMAGEKIEQAKRALLFCLNSLDERDRFQVIRFSTEAEPLFDGLRPADKGHVARAKEFVEGFKATGGTAISDALAAALKASSAKEPGRMQAVVFLTDGQPTLGDTTPDGILKLVDAADSPFKVFPFGVGTDINTHLLDRIAEETKAATEYVLPTEDIEVKVSRFYEKVAQPAATDVRLAGANGVNLKQVHPGELPDLFRGQQLAVVGRYTHRADPGQVVMTGRVGDKALAHEAALPAAKPEHAFIAQLWATRRVGYLLDEIRLRGENKELRDEVVELARAHGIVTPYTSHLIVEDEMRRGVQLGMQTIRMEDRARQDMQTLYEAGNREQAGAASVALARENQMLKSAAAPSAPRPMEAMDVAKLDARFAGLGEAEGDVPQQVRNVRGRTFMQNGAAWLDTQAQALPVDAQPRRVVFGSDAYFDLARKHPDAAAWLAVGRNVRVVIDGKLIEVVDEG